MEPYALYFACLALFNVALVYQRSRHNPDDRKEEKNEEGEEEKTLALPKNGARKQEAQRFKREYFGVYVLVMAADWLQGPFIYTLYKDEKRLSESVVAALFTTGFVSAGIAATFVGTLADKYGRRRACLSFCAAYSISCLSVFSSSDDGSLLVLFCGRALGGLSTTLLYSVFETWMIAEYHARGLSNQGKLGDMFSASVTYSGVVAIVSGIVGEAAVSWSGTKTAPFLLAIVCLLAAVGGVGKFWGENYGQTADHHSTSPSPSSGVRIQTLISDKRILALGLATTIFEGSMYLFVFFWSPALTSARAASSRTEAPPFGLIFSCFMSAMMMGSIIFSQVDLKSGRDTGKLLLSLIALAANSLLLPVLASSSETVTFWSFAVFELCVGLYFPTMSRLKSELVDESVRGKVYGLMRLPLNVFVVLALSVTKEGDAHRSTVFTVSGVLLMAAFLSVQKFLL